VSQSNSDEGSFRDPYVTSIASAPLNGYPRRAATPSSLPGPEEGLLLIRAFVSIKDAERRQTAINFVADLARQDASDELR
jgi:hypothetical protein